MNNKQLYGRVIEKAGGEIDYDLTLEYYLNHESIREEYCDLKRYGITIKKIAEYPNGKCLEESKTINDMFYRISDAEKFMAMLIRGKVTPACFSEVVKEYLVNTIG